MPNRIDERRPVGAPAAQLEGLPKVNLEGDAPYLHALFTHNRERILKNGNVNQKEATFLRDLTKAPALGEDTRQGIVDLLKTPDLKFTRCSANTQLAAWVRGPGNTGISNVTTHGPVAEPVIEPGNVSVTNPGNATNAVIGAMTADVPVANPGVKGGRGPYAMMGIGEVNPKVAHYYGTPQEKLNEGVLREVTHTPANDPFWKSAADGEVKHVIVEGGTVMKQLKAGFGLQLATPALDAAFQAYAAAPDFMLKAAIRLTPALYLQADGTKGQRVCVYSPDWHELTETVHAHADELVQKTMKHRKAGHTVGDPKAICGGDAFQMDSTHRGWFDPFFDENGKPVLGRGDFPVDYGPPPGGKEEYTFRNQHLTRKALEFQKPVSDAAWQEALAFVRTLGALSMGKMHFSSRDLEEHDRSYFINDLENDRASRLPAETELLGKKLDEVVVIRGERVTVAEALSNRSKYCAEGTDDRPARLLHAIPTEDLRAMEKIFNAAVKADQDARGAEFPDNRVGWKALEDAGYISGYAGLVETNMAYCPFKIPGNDYQPMSAFEPKAMIKTQGPGEGLLSQPVSIAGLVQAAIGSLLPRDDLAEKMGTEPLMAAYNKADAAGKKALLDEGRAFVNAAVAGIKAKVGPLAAMVKAPPMENAIDVAKAVGLVLAATGVQTGVVGTPEVQGKIKEQARYQYMSADLGNHAPSQDQVNGKAQFDMLLGKLMGLTMMPVDARTLHVILDAEEKALRTMPFRFDYPGGNRKDEGIIVYLPPHHAIGASDGWFIRNGEVNFADYYPDGYRK